MTRICVRCTTPVGKGKHYCPECAKQRRRESSATSYAKYHLWSAPKPCAHCAAPFKPHTTSNQKYCSAECQQASGNARSRARDRARRVPTEKSCAECGARFDTFNPRQRYCSRNCAERPGVERNVKERISLSTIVPEGVAPSTVGAIAEHRVAADLLLRGYEVFRASSPTCSCDLIAYRGGVMRSLEVRTGQITVYQNGRQRVHWTRKDFRADAYAVVLPDQIKYVPELEEAQP